MTSASHDVKSRNQVFAERAATRIWQEQPSTDNPYLADTCLCHGYDILELMRTRSFVDVWYLLFRGELPNAAEAQLLEALMIALINPGPRHQATRAAMNAGIGKTDPVHILPIALSIMGGSHGGAGEMDAAMRFLRHHIHDVPAKVADLRLTEQARPLQGDWCIAPGFGSRYGGIDPMPLHLARALLALPGSGPALRWGMAFAGSLCDAGLGWYTTGVAAAVFCDLGFHPRVGAGLFQILCAPGLLAHGLEQANKPITAMPHIQDENYVIET